MVVGTDHCGHIPDSFMIAHGYFSYNHEDVIKDYTCNGEVNCNAQNVLKLLLFSGYMQAASSSIYVQAYSQDAS